MLSIWRWRSAWSEAVFDAARGDGREREESSQQHTREGHKRPEHRSPSTFAEDTDSGDGKHDSRKELGGYREAERSTCARASSKEQQQ